MITSLVNKHINKFTDFLNGGIHITGQPGGFKDACILFKPFLGNHLTDRTFFFQ